MNPRHHLLVVVASLLLFATPAWSSDKAEVTSWVYLKGSSGWDIFYNGAPIHFLPDVGDGAWDRPIAANPKHRYVFIDGNLSVSDAGGIIACWQAWSPRVPTDFIVVAKFGYYRYLSSFEHVDVPKDVFDQAMKLTKSNAQYEKPKK